jgi:hypothetical protein
MADFLGFPSLSPVIERKTSAFSVSESVNSAVDYVGDAISDNVLNPTKAYANRQLGLISGSPAGEDSYRFVIGEKPFLSDLLIAYCCIDFIATNDPNSKTVTTTRLASDGGGPGRLLKISESKILEALESSCGQVSSITIASPAGASQLVLDKAPQVVAEEILRKIYKVSSKKKVLNVPVVGFEAREPFADKVDSKKKLAS